MAKKNEVEYNCCLTTSLLRREMDRSVPTKTTAPGARMGRQFIRGKTQLLRGLEAGLEKIMMFSKKIEKIDLIDR